MAKKKSNAPNRAGLVVLAMVALSGVAGLAAYVQNSPAKNISFEEADSKAQTHLSKQALRDGKTSIPRPVFEDDQLRFEPQSATTPAGVDVKVFALNEFLKHAKLEGLRVIGVSMNGKVAVVDFGDGFQEAFGSQDEATFLNGIRATLGQFPDVDAVEIHASGQKVSELGHIELDLPAPVIRPDRWSNPTKPASAPTP